MSASAWRPAPTRPIPGLRDASGEAAGSDLSVVERVRNALAFPQRLLGSAEKVYTFYVDRTVVWPRARWGSFAAAVLLYLIRISSIHGFYIVTYALGIYLLNLLIGFLSPSVDPEEQDGLGGISLPQSESDEFRPFTRKLAEFQFWYWGMRAVVFSTAATFFRVFDLPVFWPILLFYFVFLFFITMKQQILHMVKHKYVPWSAGKKSYK